MLRTRVKASVRCNGNTHQLEGILTAVSNKRIMIGNVSGTGFRPDEIVAVRKAREY